MAEFTGERILPGQVEPDLWNEHAARYWFASRYAAGARVLDAGCGAGYGAHRLAQTARQVFALDVAAGAIAHAKANFTAAGLTFVQGSCAAIPFASARFDLVTSFEVIEHVEAWQACLTELRRVLAPGGVLLISTPNREYYAESRRESGPNPFHVHEFDYSEFDAALRELFPSVDLLTQNHTDGILLSPAASREQAGIAALEDATSIPEHANFFLAVCRLEPGPSPQPFVFLPTAANVLRERERHIAMLAADLARLREEKQNLVEMFRKQEQDLKESNRWAAKLDARVVVLQDELAEAQRTAAEHIARLESENVAATAAYEDHLARLGREKAEMAAGYENHIREAAESARAMASGYAAKVSDLEKELGSRTEWALRLQAELETIRASRWVRIGNKIGMGPLPHE